MTQTRRSTAVVKVSYTRSVSEAKASVRYMQHRADDLGERHARQLFNREGELSRLEVYERLEAASEQEGKTYFYRLMLNVGEGHAELSEEGRRAWVLGVMEHLAERGVTVRDWVAVSHTDQGEHDHVHVLAATNKTLQKADLEDLRHYSREAYEGQRQLEHELGLYLDDPAPLRALEREHEHAQQRQREAEQQRQAQRQRGWDMDY